LITGARSKLAIPLIEYFKRNNYQIALLSKDNLNIDDKDIITFKIDLTLFFTIDFIPDIIIHIAAYVPYNYDAKIEDYKVYDINVMSCTRILEFALKSKVKHFCLISSIDVYGEERFYNDENKLINEKDDCFPDNIYGLSKLACEKIAYTFSLLHNIKVSVLRLGPIVGPNMNKKLTIYKMIDDLLNGQRVSVKDCNLLVSFLSEKEASDAIVKACQKKDKWSVLNITGNYLQIKYLFQDLLNLSNNNSNVFFLKNKKNKINVRYSNEVAKKKIDWYPSTNFKSIVKSFISYKNS
tara:strand:+ start:216 stop:1100 length:885 start_codon:yes stop_codon:yes gene_type:complete